MTTDDTFREVAYREALAQGRTCWSCEHRKGSEMLSWCKWNRPSFPKQICRDYSYEPGSDE